MTIKHQCRGQVWEVYRHYGCSVNATVEEDGKWWCKMHAPSLVKARIDKRNAKFDAKRAEERATQAHERAITDAKARIVELARGITTNHELSAEVAKLEQLERQS